MIGGNYDDMNVGTIHCHQYIFTLAAVVFCLFVEFDNCDGFNFPLAMSIALTLAAASAAASRLLLLKYATLRVAQLILLIPFIYFRKRTADLKKYLNDH